ncbi:hypothetical protein Tco_1507471 [Tanacetum coccineum]
MVIRSPLLSLMLAWGGPYGLRKIWKLEGQLSGLPWLLHWLPMLSFQKLIDDGIINNSGVPLSDQIIQLSETMPPIKPEPDAATIEAAFQVVIEAEEASRVTDWFICNSTTELEFAPFSLYPKLLPILARRLRVLGMARSATTKFSNLYCIW